MGVSSKAEIMQASKLFVPKNSEIVLWGTYRLLGMV